MVIAAAGTIALASVTVALLALCAGTTVYAHVEVLDDAGNRIRLDAPARRIVSLAPHLTELLFDAGAGQWIVGAAAFSDYPDAARAIPRIGDSRGLDIEGIARARPDLVVAWTSGNPRRTIDRLRRLGLRVFESEPARLADIPHTLIRLGRLAGTEETARTGAAVFNDRLAQLGARHPVGPPVQVFYQIWDRPLLTVNGRHLIAQALQTCGAQNVFGHLPGLTAAPSREAVLLADPDAIAVASNAPNALSPWTKWRQSRAMRSGKVFTVDPEILHRPTLRILDGVEDLCAKLDRPQTP